MQINSNIKRLRKLRGFTQDAIAKLIGESRSTYAEWEKDTEPKPTVLSKIAEVLNVGISDLLENNEAKVLGAAVGVHKTKTKEFLELADGSFIMSTPLVLQKAYAGYLVGWGDPDYVDELPKHPIIVSRPHRGEYISFQVLGDSMDDGTERAIKEGDIITGRKIERSLWRNKLHIKEYGEFIVVTTKGIIVKHIISHDPEKGDIVCRSYNPDKKKYPDITINLDRVAQILNVIQVTKKR